MVCSGRRPELPRCAIIKGLPSEGLLRAVEVVKKISVSNVNTLAVMIFIISLSQQAVNHCLYLGQDSVIKWRHMHDILWQIVYHFTDHQLVSMSSVMQKLQL